MKVVFTLILLSFIVLSSATSTDKQYEAYIQSLTQKITSIKLHHGKKVSKLNTKISKLKNKLKSLKSSFVKKLKAMRSGVLSLKITQREMKKAKQNLKTLSKQIQTLQKKKKSGLTGDAQNTIVSQLKTKKKSYTVVYKNMKKKFKIIKKRVKSIRKTHQRMRKSLLKIRRKIASVNEVKRKEQLSFKAKLKQKQIILKDVNELASLKKRYTQRKSILESKIEVIDQQLSNSTQLNEDSVNKLKETKNKYSADIVFLTESINDVVDRESTIFAVSPKLQTLKKQTKSKLLKLSQQEKQAKQSLRDAKYELKQLKNKLKKQGKNKLSKSGIEENNKLIEQTKDTIVSLRRTIAGIRTNKNMLITRCKDKEKEFRRLKLVKEQKRIFNKLSKNTKSLIALYKRTLRIKRAIKQNSTSKLLERLAIVIRNRLETIEKTRSQHLRVARAELHMKQQRLQAPKKLKLSSHQSDQIVQTKEYFLAVDNANEIQKKLSHVNKSLNKLQQSEIDALSALTMKLKIITRALMIGQQTFEAKLTSDVVGLQNAVSLYIEKQNDLIELRKENKEKAKALKGN
ncbi:Golgin IMH1 [Entamoeba marina]